MPALAAEGGDAGNLARLAARLARANAALEVLADGAERYLALRDRDDAARFGFDAAAFAALPEEIRLRLLKRAIDRFGHEGPAELGKVESPAGGAGPGHCAMAEASEAETDPGRGGDQPDRGPDSRRTGAAAPSQSAVTEAIHKPQYPRISARRVLTTPEKPRFQRHYLTGNRAKMR